VTNGTCHFSGESHHSLIVRFMSTDLIPFITLKITKPNRLQYTAAN
jgi:hypothetical protein